MKNQYVLLLSISGLLCFNHAVKTMEVEVLDRSDRIIEYIMKYRTFTDGQLLNELKSLERQFSALITAGDFTFYMQQPDKILFLYGQSINLGNTMPPERLSCLQKLIAVLSIIRYRAFTNGQLLQELHVFEHDLSQLMPATDFAFYMEQPDKLDFLYHQLAGGRQDAMPPRTLYDMQRIIAVLSVLKASQQESTFWGESE
jgi:hypothetical protein